MKNIQKPKFCIGLVFMLMGSTCHNDPCMETGNQFYNATIVGTGAIEYTRYNREFDGVGSSNQANIYPYNDSDSVFRAADFVISCWLDIREPLNYIQNRCYQLSIQDTMRAIFIEDSVAFLPAILPQTSINNAFEIYLPSIQRFVSLDQFVQKFQFLSITGSSYGRQQTNASIPIYIRLKTKPSMDLRHKFYVTIQYQSSTIRLSTKNLLLQ